MARGHPGLGLAKFELRHSHVLLRTFPRSGNTILPAAQVRNVGVSLLNCV